MGLGQNLSLRSSVGLGYVWSDVASSGLSTLAAAMLDWKPSRYSSLEVSYRFADRAGIRGSGVQTRSVSSHPGKQTLSANLRLGDGQKWRASIYTIKGLDYPSTNLFGDLSYRLARQWRVGLRSTANYYGGLSYNDFEISLGRTIGSRELIAVWSKSQKRVMFELGSSGF